MRSAMGVRVRGKRQGVCDTDTVAATAALPRAHPCTHTHTHSTCAGPPPLSIPTIIVAQTAARLHIRGGQRHNSRKLPRPRWLACFELGLRDPPVGVLDMFEPAGGRTSAELEWCCMPKACCEVALGVGTEAQGDVCGLLRHATEPNLCSGQKLLQMPPSHVSMERKW